MECLFRLREDLQRILAKLNCLLRVGLWTGMRCFTDVFSFGLMTSVVQWLCFRRGLRDLLLEVVMRTVGCSLGCVDFIWVNCLFGLSRNCLKLCWIELRRNCVSVALRSCGENWWLFFWLFRFVVEITLEGFNRALTTCKAFGMTLLFVDIRVQKWWQLRCRWDVDRYEDFVGLKRHCYELCLSWVIRQIDECVFWWLLCGIGCRCVRWCKYIFIGALWQLVVEREDWLCFAMIVDNRRMLTLSDNWISPLMTDVVLLASISLLKTVFR